MAVIERSIVINASVEEVFAVADDPKRAAEYMDGLVRVADVTRTPKRIGDTTRFTYSVLGLRFSGKTTVTEWESNKRLAFKMEGGVGGVWSMSYVPQDKGTKVTWRVDYTMKGGILGRAVNKLLVERMNEKNMERSLENLKMLCEAEAKR